jgi:hypothetical protein
MRKHQTLPVVLHGCETSLPTFRRNLSPPPTLETEAASSSVTMVISYSTTHRHSPEDTAMITWLKMWLWEATAWPFFVSNFCTDTASRLSHWGLQVTVSDTASFMSACLHVCVLDVSCSKFDTEHDTIIIMIMVYSWVGIRIIFISVDGRPTESCRIFWLQHEIGTHTWIMTRWELAWKSDTCLFPLR